MSGPKKARNLSYIRQCVFSNPGGGKTRLIGSSPGRVLRLAPPTTTNNSIQGEDRKKLEEWIIYSHDELEEAKDFLRDEGEQYDWVWFDDLGLWSDVGLDDIWERVIADKPERKKYTLDQGEYNKNAVEIARWVRAVIGPNKFNFGMTFHTEPYKSPIKDEDGDPIELLMPAIQVKQMPNKMAGMCNLVTFLEVKEDQERVLHTQASDVWYGKNDLDMSSTGKDWAIKDPTMPKLLSRIKKEQTRGSGASSKTAGKSIKKGSGKKRPTRK